MTRFESSISLIKHPFLSFFLLLYTGGKRGAVFFFFLLSRLLRRLPTLGNMVFKFWHVATGGTTPMTAEVQLEDLFILSCRTRQLKWGEGEEGDFRMHTRRVFSYGKPGTRKGWDK